MKFDDEKNTIGQTHRKQKEKERYNLQLRA